MMFKRESKRTFRFAEKCFSFENLQTFRFADYKSNGCEDWLHLGIRTRSSVLGLHNLCSRKSIK